jgi:hypothetical protein
MNSETEEIGKDKQGEGTLSPKEAAGARLVKSKLSKVIPTERVSFDKQMAVLRAYAAASGPAKKAVSNDEVAAVFNDLAASSISLCNPFFGDVGLLIQEGRKQRPADAVFDYLHAFEWNEGTAALKLKDTFVRSWSAATLLPKLSFRQLSRDEAIQFLADDSKAQKSHRKSLDLMLEFLNASGVLKVEGNAVSKNQAGSAPTPVDTDHSPRVDAKPTDARAAQTRLEAMDESSNVERFTIPIPGKDAAVITVPRDLDADDWDMLSMMIETYIKRLRKDSIKGKQL